MCSTLKIQNLLATHIKWLWETQSETRIEKLHWMRVRLQAVHVSFRNGQSVSAYHYSRAYSPVAISDTAAQNSRLQIG